MPCSVVVGYQHFRGSCCLHPNTTLHRTSTWIFTVMKT